MNILFISYWGINEGLTQSTVVPNIHMLKSLPNINRIILCTIERENSSSTCIDETFIHVPLYSKNLKNVLLNKLSDFVSFSRQTTKIIKKYKVSLIICRSSLAGGIGYLASRFSKIPYIVESFEPHASYMLESGVWKKYDPRYWIEVFFQKIQCLSAKFLLPVSNSYAKVLVERGVAQEKILVAPCTIDFNKFIRNPNSTKRTELGIDHEAVVGVYVGKFGGMYYNNEAFEIFCAAKKVFQNFYLLILTPTSPTYVESKLLKNGFTDSTYKVMCVSHDDVSEYLSIADFAFATYKYSYSKKYLSPIKVGEYWACGLPVCLTEGVGDDASIIETTQCGATFSLEKKNLEEALKKIKCQLQDSNVREKNISLALRHRDPVILKNAYEKVMQTIDA